MRLKTAKHRQLFLIISCAFLTVFTTHHRIMICITAADNNVYGVAIEVKGVFVMWCKYNAFSESYFSTRAVRKWSMVANSRVAMVTAARGLERQ